MTITVTGSVVGPTVDVTPVAADSTEAATKSAKKTAKHILNTIDILSNLVNNIFTDKKLFLNTKFEQNFIFENAVNVNFFYVFLR